MSEKEFIQNCITELKSSKLKTFPDDFLTRETSSEFKIPPESLQISKGFFDQFEVISAKGEVILQTPDSYHAKFIVYSSRNRRDKINIPDDTSERMRLVTQYEKHLDELISYISENYTANFPNEKNRNEVATKIFNHLNVVRI